jgi:hypothetical protein
MNDIDSYSFYCMSILQEYRQSGKIHNNLDASIIEDCQEYLNTINQTQHKTNREVCL